MFAIRDEALQRTVCMGSTVQRLRCSHRPAAKRGWRQQKQTRAPEQGVL